MFSHTGIHWAAHFFKAKVNFLSDSCSGGRVELLPSSSFFDDLRFMLLFFCLPQVILGLLVVGLPLESALPARWWGWCGLGPRLGTFICPMSSLSTVVTASILLSRSFLNGVQLPLLFIHLFKRVQVHWHGARPIVPKSVSWGWSSQVRVPRMKHVI